MEPSLWQTLGELIAVLGQLIVQLLALGAHWLLLIIWVAWWLLAVNWRKAWPALSLGGWAPLVLLILMAALAWSRLQPIPCDCLGVVTVPNFWWQLGNVLMLVAVALFCGWLQGVLQWMPVSLDHCLEAPPNGSSDCGPAAGH